MTGAINFLQHARDICSSQLRCVFNEKPCPLFRYWEKHGIGECRLKYLYQLNDEEIADLVREVERWWEENGHL